MSEEYSEVYQVLKNQLQVLINALTCISLNQTVPCHEHNKLPHVHCLIKQAIIFVLYSRLTL